MPADTLCQQRRAVGCSQPREGQEPPDIGFSGAPHGRGRFVFTPRQGERYHLAITEPAGITTTFELPAVRESGTLIQSTADVYAAREAVTLRVLSTDAGPLTVTLRKREVELASLDIRGSRQQGEPVTADVTQGYG